MAWMTGFVDAVADALCTTTSVEPFFEGPERGARRTEALFCCSAGVPNVVLIPKGCCKFGIGQGDLNINGMMLLVGCFCYVLLWTR
jgi:hypothetical protein